MRVFFPVSTLIACSLGTLHNLHAVACAPKCSQRCQRMHSQTNACAHRQHMMQCMSSSMWNRNARQNRLPRANISAVQTSFGNIVHRKSCKPNDTLAHNVATITAADCNRWLRDYDCHHHYAHPSRILCPSSFASARCRVVFRFASYIKPRPNIPKQPNRPCAGFAWQNTN